MAFKIKENVAFVDAKVVAKLRVNQRDSKNLKYGLYDLDFKLPHEPKYVVYVTFQDISLYRDQEDFPFIQTIKYDRAKKLLQCPACVEMVDRVHKFEVADCDEIFVCSDCYEQLDSRK